MTDQPPDRDTETQSGDTTAMFFGRCCLLPRARQLIVDGKTVEIGARAFDTLIALVETRGAPVGKDEIQRRVWPDIFVEASNLRVQISLVRKALGADRDLIKTIPGRGFLFTGEVRLAAPVAALPPRPKIHLPMSRSAFIGRTAELTELRGRVEQGRLVTLVGTGGIGKTRLANELGWRLADLFPDGIWLVDLAPLTDPAIVGATVATVLRVPLPDPALAIDAIASALGSGRKLLIFDNCEHLIDAASALIEALLDRVPHLKIVATSQESLRLPHERVFSLDPLALPPPGETQIDRFGAVEFFVERARSGGRSLELDATTAPKIAEICRRLEGIPLALEMAAARVALLGIDGLQTRLDDRLKLLKFDPTVRDVRHQTLAAMVEWSHGLLDDTERTVFRRLAGFGGSFPLGAAVAAIGPDIDGWTAIDALGRLADKSLVKIEDSEPRRYRLLETLRLFGLKQLSLAGEEAAVAERTARYFAGVVEQSDRDWETNPIVRWLAAYRPEIDNIRAALNWAFADRARAPVAVALAGPASRLWQALNLVGEARDFVDRAEALLGPEIPPADAARLLAQAGTVWKNSDRPRSLDLLRRSGALYRDIGDRDSLGGVLSILGALHCFAGQYDEAEAALTEARAILAGGTRKKSEFTSLTNLAILREQRRAFSEARQLHLQALDIAEQIGEASRTNYVLMAAAELEFAMGAVDRAVDMARRAVDGLRLDEGYVILTAALLNLSSYLIFQGRSAEARSASEEALALLVREGGFLLNICLHQWAMLGAIDGRYDEAAQLIGFIDAGHAAAGQVRQHTEQKLDDRLRALLSANLSPSEMQSAAALGAQWTEDRAVRFVRQRLIAPGRL